MREIISALFEPVVSYWWHPYTPWHASRTVPSYELLIAGYADLILVPEPSAHVLALAENAGVELEFIPVGVEALVFITHEDNPLENITLSQVLDIYTYRNITNWAEIGGQDGRIIPLNRNPHSGSQTLMDNLVLQGRQVHEGLMYYQIGGMMDVISSIEHAEWVVFHWDEPPGPNDFALGYTVYFYLNPYWPIKTLALNGIAPSHETILSGEYPLTTNYFAVIRADTPESHPARLIANWLTTQQGQATVSAAGLGTLY
jgi:phosphate transport system substrate-binding protein